MTYKIYVCEGYLKPFAKNVEEDDLTNYGEIQDKIYKGFDKPKHVGYSLKKGLKKYYAFKEIK